VAAGAKVAIRLCGTLLDAFALREAGSCNAWKSTEKQL
jgi:hypothetical protein